MDENVLDTTYINFVQCCSVSGAKIDALSSSSTTTQGLKDEVMS
jgi:hypothetical protein